MMVHASDPNTQEADTGEFLGVRNQPRLHNERQASQGCIERPCLKVCVLWNLFLALVFSLDVCFK